MKYGNNSRLLFTDNNTLMCEIKTEDVYENFSKDKEMFDFSNYSAESKYHDDSNKLVVGKIKDQTGVVKELLGLKPKIHSFLTDDSSKHKLLWNVVATISHEKYKDVLLRKNVWDIQLIEFKIKII